jgi:uncharacterized protein (DUF433 family)
LASGKRVRKVQIFWSFSGGFCPMSLPLFHGIGRTVLVVLDLVSAGMGPDEILADHPELEREDILACLHYARLVVSGELLRRVA